MNISIKKYFLHLLLVIMIILPLILGNQNTKDYSSILYFFQLTIFYIYLYKYKTSLLYVTPIMVLIFYIDFSFGLGSYAFSNEIVIIQKNYYNYLSWQFNDYLTSYILAANYILFLIDLTFIKKYLQILHSDYLYSSFSIKNQKSFLIISMFFFILFLFLKLDITFLGGSGDMSYIPKAISALIFIYYLSYNKIKVRYIYYILIIFLFASFSYDSKREAIFFIFPILLLEFVLNSKKINFNIVLKSLLAIVTLIILILIMTVMRGYGSHENVNIFETLPLVIDYINEENFLGYFFLNIETNYTYFHSMQAMEYIVKDLNLLTFGTTFIKFLFITIPSSIAEFKPHSVVDLYTTIYDPAFRLRGGSWAVSIYSEFFWNFYFASPIFIIPFFYFISKLFLILLKYIKSGLLIKHSWMLFAYMTYVTLIRGSGLDLFVIYVLFGVFFSSLYLTIFSLLNKNRMKL